MAEFVTRGSKPAAGQAERSGEGGFGGLSPDYRKAICQSGGGDECNKRFVVANHCSSE
jgi:hypothetical protein